MDSTGIIAALGTTISGLAGVIWYLFKYVIADKDKQIAKGYADIIEVKKEKGEEVASWRNAYNIEAATNQKNAKFLESIGEVLSRIEHAVIPVRGGSNTRPPRRGAEGREG